MKCLPYKEISGSILYLSTMTRPDIAYYICILCKFIQDPSMECYSAAIGLLLYVGKTKHKFIHFDGNVDPPVGLHRHGDSIRSNAGFVAYSDASWRDPHVLGYNMFGYVCYLYGGPISLQVALEAPAGTSGMDERESMGVGSEGG